MFVAHGSEWFCQEAERLSEGSDAEPAVEGPEPAAEAADEPPAGEGEPAVDSDEDSLNAKTLIMGETGSRDGDSESDLDSDATHYDRDAPKDEDLSEGSETEESEPQTPPARPSHADAVSREKFSNRKRQKPADASWLCPGFSLGFMHVGDKR